MYVDNELLTGSLDNNLRDTRVKQLLLDELANGKILMKLLGVVFSGKPIGLPPIKGAQPESIGMDFLTHVRSSISRRIFTTLVGRV